MKGSYVLVIRVDAPCKIEVGALKEQFFPAGIYAYVGSAQAGIEQRVGRHRSSQKKLRWHVDHLLTRGDVLSVVSLPVHGKQVECMTAKALLEIPGSSIAVPGFGASDCDCPTHLVYLGDADPELHAEDICMRLSMLPGVYPVSTRE